MRAGPETGLGLENMRHVISIHDVVSDTMHQFAPTYHDYVLYSNGGSKDAPKTVRALKPLPQLTSQAVLEILLCGTHAKSFATAVGPHIKTKERCSSPQLNRMVVWRSWF